MELDVYRLWIDYLPMAMKCEAVAESPARYDAFVDDDHEHRFAEHEHEHDEEPEPRRAPVIAIRAFSNGKWTARSW